MASLTDNYNLTKPAEEDFYDITVQNRNWDIIDTTLSSLKTAVESQKGVRELTLRANAWSGTAPFMQEVPIAGITAADVPIGCPKVPSGASAEYKKSTTYIDGFTASNGKITFYCNRKKPTVDVTVLVKGV